MKRSELQQIIREEIKNVLNEATLYGKFEIDKRVHTIKNLTSIANKIVGKNWYSYPSALQNHTTITVHAPNKSAVKKLVKAWKDEGLDWVEEDDFTTKLRY